MTDEANLLGDHDRLSISRVEADEIGDDSPYPHRKKIERTMRDGTVTIRYLQSRRMVMVICRPPRGTAFIAEFKLDELRFETEIAEAIREDVRDARREADRAKNEVDGARIHLHDTIAEIKRILSRAAKEIHVGESRIGVSKKRGRPRKQPVNAA